MCHRIDTLTSLAITAADKYDCSRVSLVGMSLGSYLAGRACLSIEANNISVSNIVMQSPAAFPREVDTLTYGSEFKEQITNPWNVIDSPVFDDIRAYLKLGGRMLVSYFEKDNPPIPHEIQNAYHQVCHEMLSKNASIQTYSITGVEHNFRRLNSDSIRNIVNNDSVRAVAHEVTGFIK